MNENTNNRNWYTVEEFAKMVNKSKAVIYNWKKIGILKTFNVTPRCIAVPASEYERYLNHGLLENDT